MLVLLNQKITFLHMEKQKQASTVIQRTIFSGPLMPSATITARDGKCSDFLSLFSYLIILKDDDNFMFFSPSPIRAQNPPSKCGRGIQA